MTLHIPTQWVPKLTPGLQQRSISLRFCFNNWVLHILPLIGRWEILAKCLIYLSKSQTDAIILSVSPKIASFSNVLLSMSSWIGGGMWDLHTSNIHRGEGWCPSLLLGHGGYVVYWCLRLWLVFRDHWSCWVVSAVGICSTHGLLFGSWWLAVPDLISSRLTFDSSELWWGSALGGPLHNPCYRRLATMTSLGKHCSHFWGWCIQHGFGKINVRSSCFVTMLGCQIYFGVVVFQISEDNL